MILNVFYRFIVFVVQGFGAGRIPFMPGTWGTLVGLGIVYLLSSYWENTIAEIIGLSLFSLVSWYLIHIYEVRSNTHDDQKVVLDEIMAVMICFIGFKISMPLLIAGFVVFRFLDILKPFPISWIDQKIPGALGTLLDDLMAGVIGCGILHLVVYWGYDF